MRSLIKAAIRIIIILFFFQLLRQFLSAISSFTYMSHYSGYEDIAFPLAIVIATGIVAIIVLVVLWIKTDWLVKVIAGDLNENELVINTSNSDLIKTALRILGLFLLITSIPELLGLASYHIRIENELSNAFMSLSPEQKAHLTQEWILLIVKIIIGIWLTTGLKGGKPVADGVSRFWRTGDVLGDNNTKE